jgi:hypothetical protein
LHGALPGWVHARQDAPPSSPNCLWWLSRNGGFSVRADRCHSPAPPRNRRQGQNVEMQRPFHSLYGRRRTQAPLTPRGLFLCARPTPLPLVQESSVAWEPSCKDVSFIRLGPPSDPGGPLLLLCWVSLTKSRRLVSGEMKGSSPFTQLHRLAELARMRKSPARRKAGSPGEVWQCV